MLARLVAAAILAALLSPLFPARADEPHLTPSWMRIDASAKRVTLDVIAGFNANDGALNYNGYFAGDMSVMVPVGWSVTIHFKNSDAMLPHSLLVTKPYGRDHFPDQAGVNDVAISRAYTDNPDQGLPAPKTDTVEFVADKAGPYYLFCGVPGHGQGGMWTHFVVDAAAAAPYATVAAGAEPGRP